MPPRKSLKRISLPYDTERIHRKTRQALEIAYAGFDNALESDLIDSYIYEINAFKKGISISQSWPLCSRRIRKKIYTNIPRFVPWSAMFSVNWFLP